MFTTSASCPKNKYITISPLSYYQSLCYAIRGNVTECNSYIETINNDFLMLSKSICFSSTYIHKHENLIRRLYDLSKFGNAVLFVRESRREK